MIRLSWQGTDFDPVPDAMIDVTEFLDETYIDVDRLLEKVSQIDK